jgi:hypothetical protein
MPSFPFVRVLVLQLYEIIQAQCLTLVIATTWEAEVGRITVWGQPGQKVSKIP